MPIGLPFVLGLTTLAMRYYDVWNAWATTTVAGKPQGGFNWICGATQRSGTSRATFAEFFWHRSPCDLRPLGRNDSSSTAELARLRDGGDLTNVDIGLMEGVGHFTALRSTGNRTIAEDTSRFFVAWGSVTLRFRQKAPMAVEIDGDAAFRMLLNSLFNTWTYPWTAGGRVSRTMSPLSALRRRD